MPELDILYMTRVQRERFFNEEDYLRLKDSYILTPESSKTRSRICASCTRCPVSMRFPSRSTTTREPAISSRFATAGISAWL